MSQLFGKLLVVPKRGGRFTMGIEMCCVLTTRCQLHCPYCPMWAHGRNIVKYDECTPDEWIKFFEGFPHFLSCVALSGGESTLYDGLPEIAHHLANRGTHVRIYSNLLKIETLLRIDPRKRISIVSTYHHGDDYDRWVRNVKELKLWRYKFIVNEVESPQMIKDPEILSYREFKGKYTQDFIDSFVEFHAAPTSPLSKIVYLGPEGVYSHGQPDPSAFRRTANVTVYGNPDDRHCPIP